jgi:hypothetical protein
MSNINMGMNIGMGMNIDMGMTFHTKQTNLMRPKQNRAITTTTLRINNGDGIVDAKLMFQSPMIDRVVKAKSGCSACGR